MIRSLCLMSEGSRVQSCEMALCRVLRAARAALLFVSCNIWPNICPKVGAIDVQNDVQNDITPRSTLSNTALGDELGGLGSRLPHRAFSSRGLVRSTSVKDALSRATM